MAFPSCSTGRCYRLLIHLGPTAAPPAFPAAQPAAQFFPVLHFQSREHSSAPATEPHPIFSQRAPILNPSSTTVFILPSNSISSPNAVITFCISTWMSNGPRVIPCTSTDCTNQVHFPSTSFATPSEQYHLDSVPSLLLEYPASQCQKLY